MAARTHYPLPAFTGTDVSPALFPATPPTRCAFETQNTLALPADWTGRYTIASQRMLMGAFTAQQWPAALGELTRVLRPGGWLQLIEGTRHTAGPVSARMMTMLGDMAAARGLRIDVAGELRSMLVAAGFEDVEEVRVSAPLGEWAGEIGTLGRKNVVAGYRAMKVSACGCHSSFFCFKAAVGLIASQMGFVKAGFVASEEEYDDMMDAMAEELDNTPSASMDWVACFGRKPCPSNAGIRPQTPMNYTSRIRSKCISMLRFLARKVPQVKRFRITSSAAAAA